MKKLKYLSIVMVIGLMVFLTSATTPSTGENGFMGKRGDGFHWGHKGVHHGMMLNSLSDEQKEQIKQLRVEMMKNSIPVKNELNEKRARLRTLTTGNKVDVKGAEKVLADIEELKTKQAKQQVRVRVEIRKLLNDEQRVMFDAHAGMVNKERGRANFHHGQHHKIQKYGKPGQMHKRPCMQGMQGRMQQPGVKKGVQGKPGMGMKGKHGVHGKQGMQAHKGMQGKGGMKGKPGNRPEMKQGGMMNFTAEQQEQLKTLRVEQMKSMTQFRNKLGEFNAKMKTITSSDDVNLKDVDNLLDEMGKVKLEMAKDKLSHQMSVRAMLTDEQKVMMDMHR